MRPPAANRHGVFHRSVLLASRMPRAEPPGGFMVAPKPLAGRPRHGRDTSDDLWGKAINRRPEAIDTLTELVATGTEPTATAALSALWIYKEDPRLRERIAGLVRERESTTLRGSMIDALEAVPKVRGHPL